MHFLRSIAYSTSSQFVESLQQRLRDSKVVHLTNVPSNGQLLAFYESLAGRLGQLLKKGEQVEQQTFVDQEWLDIRYDPHKANTFRHSNTGQPLHTDGAYVSDFPCEIVFLFCLRQADQGGATLFLDGAQLVQDLSARQPALLRDLESLPVRFCKGRMGQKTVPIIRRESGSVLLNWNQFRVSEDNPRPVQELVRRFRDYLEEEMQSYERLVPVRLAPGEAVFFHDQRVLHGRAAFEGERCLIKGVVNLSPRFRAC